MILTRKNYIYYIFILNAYLRKIIGKHSPIEIIKLIIMSAYEHIKISCGSKHVVLLSDKIYVWGRNEYGQLGLGHHKTCVSPTELRLHENIRSISCGWYHTIALTYVPNKMYVWGSNESGELGLGNYDCKKKPRKLFLPTTIRSVSCGGYHTIALTNIPNKIYVWGCNSHGQLGLGHDRNKNTPQELILCGPIISIDCGGFFTIALIKNSAHSNKLYGWGCIEDEQFGSDYIGNTNSPQKINLHKNVVSVNCGGHHAIVLTNNNEIYVWGSNINGELGLGYASDMHSLQKLNFDERIASISCGGYHTVALTKFGECYVWGNHRYAKLYSTSLDKRYSPHKLKFRDEIVSINCGENYTIILTTSGKIYVWGNNENGQLGLGHTINKYSLRELKF